MTSLYSHDSFFGSILVDYQTGLSEKHLVTENWSQSSVTRVVRVFGFLDGRHLKREGATSDF